MGTSSPAKAQRAARAALHTAAWAVAAEPSIEANGGPGEQPTPARGARRGGWRRHSKRHASRRNLKAPVAFKISMIH